MEGKGSFFNIVLLFILAFLSLTLAALAGYVFIGGGASKTPAPSAVVQAAETKLPADADLAEFELLSEKTMFNLKNADLNADPNTTVLPVIQVQMGLEYLKVAPKKTSSIKDTPTKVEAYKNKILGLVITYFKGMTREEAFALDAQEKANKELTIKINDLLNENEEKKAKIVYNVVFSYWLAT